MRESLIVRKLRYQLEKQLPEAVVFKLSDLRTSGIPDVCVNYRRAVAWVEVKLLKEHETLSTFRQHLDALQLAMCIKLERQVFCRYLIAMPGHPLQGVVIQPSALRVVREATELSYDQLRHLATDVGSLDVVIQSIVEAMRGLQRP